MKRVLKKKEKSPCEAKKSKPRPMKSPKAEFNFAERGLGLINLQTWNSKKRRIMKIQPYFSFAYCPIAIAR